MKVTALIVTFNRLDKLKKCIKSTLLLDFQNVVIVNNASTDSTKEWLMSLDDDRLIVINESINTGGAGGFYAGSSYICKNIDTDWVFFYDDDAYPAGNMLEKFREVVSEDWGVYCSLVVDPQGMICKMNLPFIKIPHTLSESFDYRKRPSRYIPEHKSPVEVQTLSFVGAGVNKKVLENNLSSIHSGLFIYYDDVFFGFDLYQRGVKIRYSPELVFTHDVQLSESVITPEWKVYYLIRNLLLSIKIYGEIKPYSTSAIIFRLAKYFLISRLQNNKLKYIKYYVKGCIDGLRGIYGKKH
ncbi:glycosyltransferase [Shigella sonnei]|nr:glycosyltransferase [Shigella sonnei]